MTFSASTGIQQLGHSASRLSMMIGAKNFVKSDEERWVSFRFTAKSKNKSNYFKMTLNGMDLYDITFGSIRGDKYTIKGEFSNCYVEDLKTIFESETGLYLSL